MQIFSNFLMFVLIWWILFFIFLSLKNETSNEWQIGNANSAPTKSYLLIKVLITSVLSFIILITLIYFGLDLAFIFKQ
jgi:predicted secreted protein